MIEVRPGFRQVSSPTYLCSYSTFQATSTTRALRLRHIRVHLSTAALAEDVLLEGGNRDRRPTDRTRDGTMGEEGYPSEIHLARYSPLESNMDTGGLEAGPKAVHRSLVGPTFLMGYKEPPRWEDPVD